MQRVTLLFLLLVLGSSQVGCARFALGYAGWKRDMQNDRADRVYSKAVAEHAGDSELTGTWTREEEIQLGKKMFNKEQYRYKLTLFADRSYAYRIEKRSPYARIVSVQEGQWVKAGAGVISLTPEKMADGAEPILIQLGEWTNVFVEADRQLHQ